MMSSQNSIDYNGLRLANADRTEGNTDFAKLDDDIVQKTSCNSQQPLPNPVDSFESKDQEKIKSEVSSYCTAMRNKFRLTIQSTVADGNCLFRSVSQQVQYEHVPIQTLFPV